MASKKENLPVSGDVTLQNGGSITYANEVIAIIAGVAASEVEGVAGMCNAGGISDIIGKNRNITRGVKVELGTQETGIEIYTVVDYGRPVHKVAAEVQENVRKAVENMTGLTVVKVDVHVQGVSFEKEKAAQINLESGKGKTAVLTEAAEETPAEAPKAEEAEAAEAPEASPEAGEAAETAPEAGSED
ncbi:MAG: Asp23/Gls24 family envelope stress response protein [Clostridiales bacterium]|nr:Asp23/Gls24 family envelope stress response protein [Clostridiales bacterium]